MKLKHILASGILIQLMLFTYSESLPVLNSSQRISITANANNKYVCVDQTSSKLIANNNSQEEYYIIKNLDGTYSIQSVVNGNFVSADNSLSPPYMVANRTVISTWEKFQIIDKGGNKFSLLSYNGKYVSADLSLSQPYLVANRTAASTWEIFTMTFIAPGGLPKAGILGKGKFGYPGKFDVKTYYQYDAGGFRFQECAKAYRDNFASLLKTKLGLTIAVAEGYSSTGFNLTKFRDGTNDQYQLVEVESHGNDGYFTEYNGYAIKLRGTTDGAIIAKDTRFLILNTCFTLFHGCGAPFDAMPYKPCFKGAHVILGWVTASYDFYYSAGINSEQMGKYFATNWITGAEGVFDAWKDAANTVMYSMGGFGVGPAVVFTVGDLYGQYSTPQRYYGYGERLDNIYNGATFFNSNDQMAYPAVGEVLAYNPGWGYPNMVGHKWYQYGNPNWSGVSPMP